MINDKHLEVGISMTPSVPVNFWYDAKIYKEILFNLIQNAVKFNNQDGVINVKISFDPETSLLNTEITDSGAGINKEKQKSLFYAFRGISTQRNQSMTKNKEDRSGIGIGLSNAKILCEAMGGSISLKSAPGKGTVVNFSVDV